MPLRPGFPGNKDFNPRSPYGERLPPAVRSRRCIANFNPRSPYGERLQCGRMVAFTKHFNPRSPYGERHGIRDSQQMGSYFNPRSPYGERLSGFAYPVCHETISIHAPLTGSDLLQPLPEPVRPHFNPRSPYGERLLATSNGHCPTCYFNPRSPYGERHGPMGHATHAAHFNPRSPYGERHFPLMAAS